MARASSPLTMLAEVAPDRLEVLRGRLALIGAAPDDNGHFRPGALPDTHFTRFLLIEDAELAPLLAWESNFDGEPADYLAAVAAAAPEIDHLFGCCVDYPAGGARDLAPWRAWVTARLHRPAAFYCAYPGVARSRIVNDREVHEQLREIVDHDRAALAAGPPSELPRVLRERLAGSGLDLSRPDDGGLRRIAAIATAIIVGLPLLVLALIIVLPWLAVLLRHEAGDPAPTYRQPVHDHGGFHALEDQATQNQLTHLVDLKPGRFRLFTAWVVLAVIHQLARLYFVHGDLGGITSIHFARWVIIRDRRDLRALPAGARRRHRLLFFSNYDGSWESYLGEFVDRAARGLTAVWSNAVDFPRTRRLTEDGARDEEAFKQWARNHQRATQVWWTGAAGQTVQNIRDDLELRRGLSETLPDDEVARWLTKL
jgi:hypothetical protein